MGQALLRVVAAFIVGGCSVAVVGAQAVTASKRVGDPPQEIAAAVRERLSAEGAAAKVGETLVEIWVVKSIVTSGEGPGWTRVPEGALVGAIRLSAPLRDIRGRAIKPGVYLLRFGLQPQNGDHLGVSPHREFLLVTPAAKDQDPAAGGHDSAVDLAAASIGSSHPAVLGLDPPVASDPPLTVRTTPDGHTSVVFSIPTSRDGEASSALTFGLVLHGLIEA